MDELLTYVTLYREVLDLTQLSALERAYLALCVQAFRDGMAWERFADLKYNSANPLLHANSGRSTSETLAHPLFRAIADMDDRLGISQNQVGPEPGDEFAPADPFADEWLSTTDAAKRKGVALSALHLAIDRGEVIARPRTPGGVWKLVSANSLDRWKPSPARQRAGRAAAVAR